MKCREIKEWLELNLTATGIELTPEVREHMGACDDCRAYYNELLKLIEEFEPVSNLTLNEDEAAFLEKNLAEKIDSIPIPVPAEKRRPMWARLTSLVVRPAAALLSILLIASISMKQPPANYISDVGSEVISQNISDTQDLDLVYSGDTDELMQNVLDDDSKIEYFTGQVPTYKAEEILNNMTAEEYQYLMKNLVMEI